MNKTAEKFRKLADGLQKHIDAKRASRNENTPKRMVEAARQRIDADHLERVQAACNKLADGHEDGTLPPELAGIKSKAELEAMLRTRIDTSRGYYSVRDTNEYHDRSPVAVAVQALICGAKTPEQIRADHIRELENNLKFSTIPAFFPTSRPVIDRMIELAHV